MLDCAHMSSQKTIGITMSRGGTARNILQTHCFSRLKECGHRVVIISPAADDAQFIKTFEAPNVFFEKMHELPWRFSDRFFVGVHKGLVYNRSTVFRDLYGVYNPDDGSKIKYWLRRIFIRPFSYFGFLKVFASILDSKIVLNHEYDALFIKYKFDLLFSTSMIEDNDVEVMKTAKKFKVPIIAMPKTWDNASKMNIRVRPQKIIVWGEYSKREIMRYSHFPEKDIVICGIPQFDFYKSCEALAKQDRIQLSREAFCARVGLDATKKIIVFGSEGWVCPNDPDIVDMLTRAIGHGFIQNAQIFVRPHFMYPDDEKRFDRFRNMPHVIVDTHYTRSKGFRDNWDYSQDQIVHFSNMIMHADLMITGTSTLVVDAAAVDCPIINIAFDGYEKKDFVHSIARWYLTEHYGSIKDSDAAQMVYSETELIAAVNLYLENPSLKREERRKLIENFGYRVDGNSGVRVAEAVLSVLK